jgi:hypothetical protein
MKLLRYLSLSYLVLLTLLYSLASVEPYDCYGARVLLSLALARL